MIRKSIYISAIVILSILFTAMISCKKDDPDNPLAVPHPPIEDTIPNYDTIFPLSYLPVYPGSFWKYIDPFNDTIALLTDTAYILDFYEVGAAAYVSDTFYVPVYDGDPIWGYEAHTGPISHAGSYPLTRILSDSLPVGSSWVVHSWSGTVVRRKIIAKDTNIMIQNHEYSPTIVVEEYYSEGPLSYIWIARRYFTKNIGMIKEELFNMPDSTITTSYIINYHINK